MFPLFVSGVWFYQPDVIGLCALLEFYMMSSFAKKKTTKKGGEKMEVE